MSFRLAPRLMTLDDLELYKFARFRTFGSQQRLNEWRSGMDTGRVDPRVGSGRVRFLGKFGGSGRVEISEMHYFFLFVGRLK